MIKVLIDNYGIVKQKGITIASYKEYAKFWDEIVLKINDERKMTVVLKSSKLKHCFQNLKEKFGAKIKIQNISPRAEWEKLLNFKLPDEVEEDKIANILLSESIEKIKKARNKKVAALYVLSGLTDFSDIENEYPLMECMLRGIEDIYPQFLSDNLDDMIKSLPTGKREYWQRLKEEENKKAMLLGMMETLIVKNYPSDSNIYRKYYKQTLNYSMFDFPARLSSYIDEKFKREVRSYLGRQKGGNVLKCISGKLKEEWEAVCEFFKNNPIQNKENLTSLLKKPIEYPEFYENIEKYLPVSPPPINITEENIKNWIDKYFDFYLYTRRIDRPQDTESNVRVFEDFLLKHYSNLTEFFTQHSILTVRQKMEEYLKMNRKILLLVVDGLSYAYHKELEKIFGKECFSLFSTLPTITEVNKKHILSGLFDLSESYEQIIEKIYGKYQWKEISSDQMDLKDFLRENFDLYIYWENEFDAHIHRPKAFDKRFKDHIRILQRIPEQIEKFLEDGGVVLLIGDHGYTTLPSDQDDKDDKIIVSTEGVNITHNRVLKINGTKRNICTINDIYWIDRDVAVPKAYHYFNSPPRGATHGGATPEEVVVPFLIVQKTEEGFQPLKFKLAEEKYLRRRRHSTRLIINNPNMCMVRVTSIKFLPSIIRAFPPTPLLLKPNENIFEAELNLQAVTSEKCRVSIEYEVYGNVLQAHLDILTTGAMKEIFNEWE